MSRQEWEGTEEFPMYELGYEDGFAGNLRVRVQQDGEDIPEDHPVQRAFDAGFRDGLAEQAAAN